MAPCSWDSLLILCVDACLMLPQINHEEAISFLRSLVMSEKPNVASRLLLFIGDGIDSVDDALMQSKLLDSPLLTA